MDEDRLCFLPATQLDTLYRDGEVSPVEVVDAVLARIERMNPALNAYCTVAEGARAAAAFEAVQPWAGRRPPAMLDGRPSA